MMKKPFAVFLAAFSGVLLAASVAAADALPPADPSRPVTTARVGGSPADAAFRDAQQTTGAAFREARSACRAKERAERGACMNAARAELKHARLDARAAHDASKKAR